MLLKKLLFLSIPVIFVYWRSRTAQQAVRWLFRGVVPQDGMFGKVMTELRQAPAGPGEASRPQRPVSLAARVANAWPILLAFLAGMALMAILFSRFVPHE